MIDHGDRDDVTWDTGKPKGFLRSRPMSTWDSSPMFKKASSSKGEMGHGTEIDPDPMSIPRRGRPASSPVSKRKQISALDLSPGTIVVVWWRIRSRVFRIAEPAAGRRYLYVELLSSSAAPLMLPTAHVLRAHVATAEDVANALRDEEREHVASTKAVTG